ncbi:MAG: TRAP transporter small permease subunit, partial [Desulfobacterales bacterium]|nr:TRAP transporter small permease subunit [Desulfobacterales bacterium]
MDRVARRFEQALRFFTRLEDTFLVSLLSFMIGLAFLQIVLRDFFSTGLLWADPLLKNLVIWVGLVGASIATREDKHITIDVIPRVL